MCSQTPQLDQGRPVMLSDGRKKQKKREAEEREEKGFEPPFKNPGYTTDVH